MARAVLISVIGIFLAPVISGFLFDDCEAPIQCTCSYSSIKCSDKMLPRIPVFNFSHHYSMMYLNLQHNRIIVVPQNSFHGVNAEKIYIDLSHNNLYDIDQSAFDDVQENVTILKLNDNHLSTLPVAVANLSNLIYFDIQRNPIQTFDQDVMQSIGSHLEIFYVGSSAMNIWPHEFNLLKQLQGFHLSDVPLTYIPRHSFQSFAHTLHNLEIYNSNLSSIPTAICDLSKLVNFYFTNHTNLQMGGIVPSCGSPLVTVATVKIGNNKLVDFPNVFPLFTNMQSLSVSSNPDLRSMSGVNIPATTKLSGLFLPENGFETFPSELENLTDLHSLDLHSNNITMISNTDLNHISHLTRLFLSNNPIKTIEDYAFLNMTALYQLRLDNTALTSIPAAITDLPKIHILDFKGNGIVCTCDNLGWLGNWTQVNSLSVTGNCYQPHKGEPISSFISLELPTCN